jgi:hypothetical protein
LNSKLVSEGSARAVPNLDFARYAVDSLRAENFTLVDLGCAGGINPVWRIFGSRLRALAIDASMDECRRLADGEELQGIEYVSAFAGIAPDHPFVVRRGGEEVHVRNPWPRLSAAHTMQRREAKLRAATDQEKIRQSTWWLTETADASRPVIVPDMLSQRGMDNVDFLKIDTDGNDFGILNSFDGCFDKFGILGAYLEVNFCGSPDDTNRTFHNTDRFMKAQGFELFDLSVRRYSAAALPAPYELDIPAQTISGRILQGDALYIRDWAAADWAQIAAQASVEKLIKLAAIFSLMSLPDCAAEILIAFRARFSGWLAVDRALDLLSAQIQPSVQPPLSYKAYLSAFQADSPDFYPKPNKG